MSKKGIELLKQLLMITVMLPFLIRNMMQLDYIKKALGELSENARGEFGKRTPDSDMFDMAFSLEMPLTGKS